jgi:hypothetical protein
MHKRYSIPVATTLGALATVPAMAGEVNVKVTLPEIKTGMYLNPYLAVWVEKADDTFVQTLSLWHMQKDKRGNAMTQGDRYLNSVRTWWRSAGITSQMPIDGISSATRGTGTHELVFTEGKGSFKNLAPGKYQLVFEAVREVKDPPPAGTQPPNGADGMMAGPPPEGGEGMGPPPGGADAMGAPPAGGMAAKDSSEVVRLDFEWPVKSATTLTKSGKTELGKVVVTLTP